LILLVNRYLKIGPHKTFLIKSELDVGTKIAFLLFKNMKVTK